MVKHLYKNPRFGQQIDGKIEEEEFLSYTSQKEVESICINCHKTVDKCGRD